MYKYKKGLTFLALFSACFNCNLAHADLPLTVEDLTTDKNRFKLDTSLNYYNQNDTGLNSTGYSVVDLGNGRTVTIPNVPTEGSNNIDSIKA